MAGMRTLDILANVSECVGIFGVFIFVIGLLSFALNYLVEHIADIVDSSVWKRMKIKMKNAVRMSRKNSSLMAMAVLWLASTTVGILTGTSTLWLGLLIVSVCTLAVGQLSASQERKKLAEKLGPVWPVTKGRKEWENGGLDGPPSPCNHYMAVPVELLRTELDGSHERVAMLCPYPCNTELAKDFRPPESPEVRQERQAQERAAAEEAADREKVAIRAANEKYAAQVLSQRERERVQASRNWAVEQHERVHVEEKADPLPWLALGISMAQYDELKAGSVCCICGSTAHKAFRTDLGADGGVTWTCGKYATPSSDCLRARNSGG
jgi:hypothetical protein